ncbi:MAG: GAF domain-containing protein [Armatimonadetes bacterium]|nr:GAF domain-containing protein [Armatimonadota bacterium]
MKFEFIGRLGFVAALLGAIFAFNPVGIAQGGQAALLLLAYFGFVALLERRDLRTPLVSTLMAVADLAVTGFMVMLSTRVAHLGFMLPLAPAYLIRFRSANASFLIPIGGIAPLCVSQLSTGNLISANSLVQSAISVLILVLAKPSEAAIESKPIVLIEKEPEVPSATPDLELRESYRELREHVSKTEKRSKKERRLLQLTELVFAPNGEFWNGLTNAVRELTGAPAVRIFCLESRTNSLVVRSSSGDFDTAEQIVPIPLGKGGSESLIQDRAAHALGLEDEPRKVGNLLLKFDHRLIGMITLYANNEGEMESAMAVAQSLSAEIAKLISHRVDQSERSRRLTELEVLYSVATASAGAESSVNLISRVVHQLADETPCDFLGIFAIDGNELLPISQHGTTRRVLDAMSFAAGRGVPGYVGIGAPELHLWNTQDDPRLSSTDLAKLRVGSFVCMPIRVAGELYGCLISGTAQVGGVSYSEANTLQLVAQELGQAITRLNGKSGSEAQMITPTEFIQRVNEAPGALIVIEPIRKEELKSEFGSGAVKHSVRSVAPRLRAILPPDGLLCRREEDVLVYVPGMDEESARKWANQSAASIAMQTIFDESGKRRIPLAVRTKVSAVNSTVENHAEIAS